ncbi:MAG: XTP/dITP diphosphatase [Candidatus Eisenbacteria sp.]|nr:XTP/dITP diphosphatase [Candidatus Eisenbacteria bacterium]
MRIVLATTNQDKLGEIEIILAGAGVELVSLQSFPDVCPADETGRTFEENARIKAVSVRDQTGLTTLADDSGLEVDALGGLPGVRSARFAGERRDYDANNRRLAAVLRGLPPEDRTARFVCVACLAMPDGEVHCVRGTLEGVIIEEPRGSTGFGYDPLFLVQEYGRTLAELGPAIKNRISHRARAMEQIRDILIKMRGAHAREPFD